MRLLILLFSIVLFFPTTIRAADCDCNHWPWPPECQQTCGGKILNNAGIHELKNFLDLDAKMLTVITETREKKKLETLDEWKSVLGEQETGKIFKRIHGLKPIERQYMLLSPKEKEDFKRKIGASDGTDF